MHVNSTSPVFALLCMVVLAPDGMAQEATVDVAQTLPEPVQVAASAEPSQTASESTRFLRMRTARQEPQALETAVVTYQSSAPGGISVDLIAAVHIAERAYYDELNQLFDAYDVVLYELVAPEGTEIPRGGRRQSGLNPLAMLQDSAKNMLGLESQLESIDYTKEHFVRADMTPQQIADKMAERGDTALTLALSTLADVMRQQNLAVQQPSDEAPAIDTEISLADLMGNPLKMKRVLARQFANTGSLDQALGGALQQLLIVDRNAEALKGLQKQIAAGKKKIGIFYGAAHLPDFEKRLLEDFGLHKTDQRWLAAWDLTQANQPELSDPAALLLNLLKSLQ